MPGEKPETCAVVAMRAWLNKAEIEHEGDNSVFRPVGRSGVESTRLSDKAVDRIVKRACRTAHVTEALANGADRASIKRQTGHRSDAMLDRYARETHLTVNNSSSRIGLQC